MVKYQDSLEKALEKRGELKQEREKRETYRIKDYFKSLNLPHLTEDFKKKGFIFVDDLKNFNMDFPSIGVNDIKD